MAHGRVWRTCKVLRKYLVSPMRDNEQHGAAKARDKSDRRHAYRAQLSEYLWQEAMGYRVTDFFNEYSVNSYNSEMDGAPTLKDVRHRVALLG